MTDDHRPSGSIIRFDELEHTRHSETEWLDGPDPTWASTPRVVPRIAARR
jgi:hypothetical protein